MRVLWIFLALSTLFADNPQYDFIKEIAEKYQRPFTLLDLGAGDGSLSFQIAREFPESVCVLVERNRGLTDKQANILFDICKKDQIKNIILLNKTLTASDLDHLSKVEHFDIVLGLDFLPHLRIPRLFTPSGILQSLLRLGDHVILRLPVDARTYIRLIKESKALKKTQENDLSLLFLMKGSSTITIRESWFDTNEPLTLTSTYEKKSLSKTMQRPPWAFHFIKGPGISLYTYLLLHGMWPEKSAIKDKVSNIPWQDYSNLAPWDIKLTGQEITIENLNFFAPSKDPIETKQRLLELFDCQTQKELREKK